MMISKALGERIFLVARSRRQAAQYAREKNLENWMYVTRYNFWGINGKIIYLSGCQHNRDYELIHRELQLLIGWGKCQVESE